MSMRTVPGDKLKEVLRFFITGVVCFGVEFVLLVILRSGAGLDTLIATPIAFLVSVIVNYLLCLKWVFHGATDNGGKTKAAFLLTSVIGLVLNELLMLLFRVLFGEDTVLFTLGSFSFSMYMLNKVMATVLVMIWNYFTKKAVLNRDAR